MRSESGSYPTVLDQAIAVVRAYELRRLTDPLVTHALDANDPHRLTIPAEPRRSLWREILSWTAAIVAGAFIFAAVLACVATLGGFAWLIITIVFGR